MKQLFVLPLFLMLILSACSKAPSSIEEGFLGGIKLSATETSLSVSRSSLLSSGTALVTLSVKDQNGKPFYIPNTNPTVLFSISGGTSHGTFSSVTNLRNGTYTSIFTGTTAGTPSDITATIDGAAVGEATSVQVISNTLSLAQSYISLSSTSVASGNTITVTLHVLDSQGNLVPSGGLAVVFSTSGGTSTGSFSTVIDNNDGTYTSTFTGLTAGTATTFQATIGGSSITSSLPTATVTHGAASKIVFSTQPVGGVAEGVSFSTQPVLSIQDANNNVVTSGVDATADVTLSLTSGTGSLTGTLTVPAVAGVATFSGISVDTQGSGKIITATKAGTFLSGGTTSKSVASNSFTINPPAPGAFTISSAAAGASIVILAWGTSTNASAYTVKYGTSSGSYGTTFSTSATSPVTITGLSPGSTYYFMVTASNVTGTTNANAETSAIPLSNFSISSATATTGNTVQLSWASSTGAAGYTVKYGTSSGNYGTTFSTSATSPVDITGLTAGTTYYFMVTATNSSGALNATSEVSAVPIGAFSISAISPAISSASVTWAAASGSTSYDILYDTTSRSGGGSYAYSSVGVVSGASISSLSTGTTYYFRVRANGVSGSVLSTNELSSAVYQNFTLNIPFTAGTESSYVISDSTRVELSGGVARLKAVGQSDNSINTGASSGGFQSGTLSGVQWDQSNGFVRLNTSTNTAELDSSWTPQWSSLTGYWKLNGNGNDDSSYGKHGALVNGSSFSSSEFKQGAGSLLTDGIATNSGYFSIPDAAHIKQQQIKTVSVWVKRLGDTAYSSGYSYVFRKGNNALTDAIQFMNTNSTTATSTFHFGVSQPVGGNAISAATTISLNQWTHFVGVIEPGIIKIYKNGRLMASNTIPELPNNSTDNISLGGKTNQFGFNGYIDEVAIWNTPLTAPEVQAIYDRQSAKYSGVLESRVMDAFSSQSWTTLSAVTTLPFFKELPAAGGSEGATAYSSIQPNLMTSLKGYWRFNESSLGTAPGGKDFIDHSGNSAHGTHNNSPTLNELAPMGKGIRLNGTNQRVLLGTVGLGNETELTVYAKVLVNSFNSSTTIDVRTPFVASWNNFSAGAQKGFNLGTYFNFTSGLHSFNFSIADGVNYCAGTSPTFTTNAINTAYAGRWLDIVGVFKAGSYIRIYINGDLVTTTTSCLPTVMSSPTTNSILGYSGVNLAYLNGYFDEAAIWNRALSVGTGPSDNEILQLYRRGSNRLKYQIRSCAQADCSDQEALTTSYKGWKGPDNTGLSYFSELYNTTSNTLYGTVSASSPSMAFSQFSGTNLAVASNRYFQYRAILESDDQNSLCNYNSASAACSPELKSIDIGPTHYDTSVQSIVSKASIGSSYQTLDTNGVTITLGSNSCLSVAKYSLSSDGTNFYYWDGNSWENSVDYTSANDGSTLRTNISSFPNSTAGTGTLQIKTFLKSSGTSACEVDNLQVTGRKY